MLIALCAIAALAYIAHFLLWKRRHLPPGPIPLPFIGNLLEIWYTPPGYDAFYAWHLHYGPMFTYWLSTVPVVAITEYKLLCETFVDDGDTFAIRFFVQELKEVMRGESVESTMEAEDKLWREQRQFTLNTLNRFGVGKNPMQERILDEVETMLANLRDECQRPVDIQHAFDICSGSVVNSLLFGFRCEGADGREFERLKALLTAHIRDAINPFITLTNLHPKLRRWPYFKQRYVAMAKRVQQLFEFIETQIADHEQSFDASVEPDDFLHAFMKEMADRRASGREMGSYRTQLRDTVMDLWVGGIETTGNTLTWAVLYLLHNEHIQRRLHEELDREIGGDRLIRWDDRSKLVLLNAFIMETQRMANLVPQNLYHKTSKDVVIRGHHIRKGTVIVPQISVVLLDENVTIVQLKWKLVEPVQVFPNPCTFNPDRFIDENGALRRYDQLIPFSIGKRQCPGEGLARMELFLMFANFVNHFKVVPLDPLILPSLQKQPGLTMHPPEFRCRIHPIHPTIQRYADETTLKQKLRRRINELEAQLAARDRVAAMAIANASPVLPGDQSVPNKTASFGDVGSQTRIRRKEMKYMIATADIHEECTVLVVWDDVYKSYVLFCTSSDLYIVSDKSVSSMGLPKDPTTEPRAIDGDASSAHTNFRKWILALTKLLQFRRVKKENNRYNLAIGATFFLVDVIPLHWSSPFLGRHIMRPPSRATPANVITQDEINQ